MNARAWATRSASWRGIHIAHGEIHGFLFAHVAGRGGVVAADAQVQAEFARVIRIGVVHEHVHGFHLPRFQIGEHIARLGHFFRKGLQRAGMGIETLLGEDDAPRRAAIQHGRLRKIGFQHLHVLEGDFRAW